MADTNMVATTTDQNMNTLKPATTDNGLMAPKTDQNMNMPMATTNANMNMMDIPTMNSE